jgi:hypothetical protein
MSTIGMVKIQIKDIDKIRSSKEIIKNIIISMYLGWHFTISVCCLSFKAIKASFSPKRVPTKSNIAIVKGETFFFIINLL